MVLPIYGAAFAIVATAIGSALLLSADPSTRALLAARYTARAGFIMFTAAYLAGPTARIWPNAPFRKLATRRRHIGVATAFVMLAHLVALAINVGVYRPRPLSAMVGGGVIYLLLFAMALTSTDAAQRRMGPGWHKLHLVGLHAVWLAFLGAYVGRLFRPEYFWTGALFASVAIALLGLRAYSNARRPLISIVSPNYRISMSSKWD